MRAEGPV
jgi:hypothetical protein